MDIASFCFCKAIVPTLGFGFLCLFALLNVLIFYPNKIMKTHSSPSLAAQRTTTCFGYSDTIEKFEICAIKTSLHHGVKRNSNVYVDHILCSKRLNNC